MARCSTVFFAKFSREQIYELREILGDGEFENCRHNFREQVCQNCCRNGTLLLPGEDELLFFEQKNAVFSPEIAVTRSELSNCLGKNGCRMENSKPILCRVFPKIFAVWGQYSWQILDHPDEKCPAAKNCGANFEQKIASARPLFGQFLLSPEKSRQIIFRGV